MSTGARELTGNAPAPAAPVIAVIGNPNTGKSTLFNVLTGLRQKTANYPGVTVERHTGELGLGDARATLVDLPGSYSLAAQSPDELIAVDVLLGHVEDLGAPSAILAVVDATNLRRNLFLVTQLAELGVPLVVAVNMMDLARERGISIDTTQLAKTLNARVVPISATKREGIDALKNALAEAAAAPAPDPVVLLPAVRDEATSIAAELRAAGRHVTPYEVERAMIDSQGAAEQRFALTAGDDMYARLLDARARLSAGSPLAAIEAKARYELIGEMLAAVEPPPPRRAGWAERIDRFTNHPVTGSLLFVLVMAIVFQAVFSWATPVMDLIDGATAAAGGWLASVLPEGALASLLVDGVIAGVGSVVIFLPQILILFTFIILLEDTGYMPRAAFLMDRLMRSVGLSGQSFIPMLSSFACAVPGIMATRVIPERRDRLATIIAAPFMTCSARLPVYALLIAAFVPARTWLGGWINLKGLVLLGLYLLGIAGGVFTAWLLKRTALRGPTPTFLIELPPYRLPNLRSVLMRLLDRARIFLRRAGTIIFTVAVVVWALVYFPRPAAVLEIYDVQRAAAYEDLTGETLQQRLAAIDTDESAALLEQSLLGRAGKTVEPVFRPLGWDWKVSAAVIAGFPAREVVIAVLGTIYAVGGEDEAAERALSQRLRGARWPDGSLVFTLPMVLGLLVFYAFCLQCAATIAVIYRETNGWVWPLFAWTYMTGLGYLGALAVYQLGS